MHSFMTSVKQEWFRIEGTKEKGAHQRCFGNAALPRPLTLETSQSAVLRMQHCAAIAVCLQHAEQGKLDHQLSSLILGVDLSSAFQRC